MTLETFDSKLHKDLYSDLISEVNKDELMDKLKPDTSFRSLGAEVFVLVLAFVAAVSVSYLLARVLV